MGNIEEKQEPYDGKNIWHSDSPIKATLTLEEIFPYSSFLECLDLQAFTSKDIRIPRRSTHTDKSGKSVLPSLTVGTWCKHRVWLWRAMYAIYSLTGNNYMMLTPRTYQHSNKNAAEKGDT